jgi:hypothetical protein
VDGAIGPRAPRWFTSYWMTSGRILGYRLNVWDPLHVVVMGLGTGYWVLAMHCTSDRDKWRGRTVLSRILISFLRSTGNMHPTRLIRSDAKEIARDEHQTQCLTTNNNNKTGPATNRARRKRKRTNSQSMTHFFSHSSNASPYSSRFWRTQSLQSAA